MIIPIINSSWSAYRTVPLIFKRGRGHQILVNVSEVVLVRHDQKHISFSEAELRQCFSPVKSVYLCSLKSHEIHNDSCEANIFWNHTLNQKCYSEKTQQLTQVIRVTERPIYLNNFQATKITWGCRDFEKFQEIDRSVWIESDPGCHVRVENETITAPIDFGQMEPALVSDVSELDLENKYELQVKNNTFPERVFMTKESEFTDKLEKVSRKSQEEVQTVGTDKPSDIVAYAGMATTVICIILLIILVNCIRKCIT